MKLPSISLALGMFLLPFTGNAQCGIIVVGDFDQTIVAGNEHTPFATNTGSNNRRGFRAQYLYRAEELAAAGLCPGFITKMSFYALQTDGAPDCLPNTNCPDVLVQVRMANSTLTDFGADAVFGNWDTVAKNSGNINANSLLPMRVIEGYIDLPLAGDGFEWTGGNLVIDISWVRAAPNGTSPAVELQEGLAYYATKSVQMTDLANINHGNTLDDVNMTPGTEAFWTTTRPLTRFWTDLNTGFTPGATHADGGTWFDTGRSVCIVQPPSEGLHGPLLLLDGLGRVVGHYAVNGRSRVEIPMERMPAGLYTVQAMGPSGAALLGKVMKP